MTRTALLALALASVCAAREAPDVRFAHGLVDRRWYDLALVAVDDALAAGPPRGAADDLRFLRADLAVEAAIATVDSATRAARLDQAAAFFDEYGKANPTSERGVDARLRVGEIWLQGGDAAAVASSADEARALFAKAERRGHELVVESQAYVDSLVRDRALGPISEDKIHEATYTVSMASLLEIRAIHHRARLLPAGADRDALLTRAAEGFRQVGFDYADQPAAYEAGILLGLVEREQGRLDDALAAFQSAADILKNFGDNPRSAAREPFFADIASRAMFLRTETLNRKGAWAQARESAREFHGFFDGHFKEGDPLAISVRLEEAVAWRGLGFPGEANHIIDGVLAATTDATLAARAGSLRTPGP